MLEAVDVLVAYNFQHCQNTSLPDYFQVFRVNFCQGTNNMETYYCGKRHKESMKKKKTLKNIQIFFCLKTENKKQCTHLFTVCIMWKDKRACKHQNRIVWKQYRRRARNKSISADKWAQKGVYAKSQFSLHCLQPWSSFNKIIFCSTRKFTNKFYPVCFCVLCGKKLSASFCMHWYFSLVFPWKN